MKKIEVFGKMRVVGMIVLCALLFSVTAVEAAQVGLNVALGNASVQANTKQTAYVRVELNGFEFKDASERPPVNLALVLDKSGSMQGEKLRKPPSWCLTGCVLTTSFPRWPTRFPWKTTNWPCACAMKVK